MLNNFSSYFEIFGGLNLAYAGSKGFRNAIDDEILKLKNEILPNVNSNIEKLKSEFIVMVSEDNGEIIDNKLTKLSQKFDLKSTEILESEKEKIEPYVRSKVQSEIADEFYKELEERNQLPF